MVNENKCPEYVESSFNIHKFSDEIQGRKVIFLALKMQDSCMLFINDQENLTFVDLTLALQSRFDREPISTGLIGHSSDNASINLANKLSKFLRKPVYISLNIEHSDRFLLPAVEKCLYEEIKSNPESF